MGKDSTDNRVFTCWPHLKSSGGGEKRRIEHPYISLLAGYGGGSAASRTTSLMDGAREHCTVGIIDACLKVIVTE